MTNNTMLPLFNDNGTSLDSGRRKAFNEFNEMVYSGVIRLESVDACFCGNGDFRTLSKYDRFGLPFGTGICRSCGLISQTLRIHPESLPVFYEKIYWPLISGQDDYLTLPKNDETTPFLLRHVPAHWRGICVFEVGCGAGKRILKIKGELAQKGHIVKAIGCDYSSDALKLAEQNGIQTIHGGVEELQAMG